MPQAIPLSAAALDELAAQYGTPFQLYDESAIRATAQVLQATFSQHTSGFKQFYAVKALPCPAVLRLLIDSGCGLDCSSASELHIAKVLGVAGEDIMYTSNYTSNSDLCVAFDQGAIMNLDDISLVDHLVAIRGRCPELISFRLNPELGRTDSETESNVLGGAKAKFGVPPSQIVEGYRRAKAAGARRFGIHMMTGSCVLDSEYWLDTISALLATAARVRDELGITFEFINIGGGLGVQYHPGRPGVDVAALGPRLVRHIADLCRRHAFPSTPKLYMENGRFMTGPSGWLVARCHVVKDANGARFFGLDACMSNLMRPGMYGSYHHITVPAREGADPASLRAVPPEDWASEEGRLYLARRGRALANVVGTLCENNDWFARGRDLPADAAVGDLFVIHDTGAHSHSMGFQYNGKLRAPELLLRTSGRVDLVRERESVHCLFDNTLMPADLQAGGPKYPYVGLRGMGAAGMVPAPAPAGTTPTAVSESALLPLAGVPRVATSFCPKAGAAGGQGGPSSSGEAVTAGGVVASAWNALFSPATPLPRRLLAVAAVATTAGLVGYVTGRSAGSTVVLQAASAPPPRA